MTLRKYTGLIILLLTIFITYSRRDILREMFNGRPFAQLELDKLILPILLLITCIYFLFPKKNEKSNRSS
jgi:hypothetical protein